MIIAQGRGRFQLTLRHYQVRHGVQITIQAGVQNGFHAGIQPDQPCIHTGVQAGIQYERAL